MTPAAVAADGLAKARRHGRCGKSPPGAEVFQGDGQVFRRLFAAGPGAGQGIARGDRKELDDPRSDPSVRPAFPAPRARGQGRGRPDPAPLSQEFSPAACSAPCAAGWQRITWTTGPRWTFSARRCWATLLVTLSGAARRDREWARASQPLGASGPRIVAFLKLVKQEEYLDAAYAMAARHFACRDDLVQKAAGWLLREAGKRDMAAPGKIPPGQHGPAMPRTTLRYAIERFPGKKKKATARGRPGPKNQRRAQPDGPVQPDTSFLRKHVQKGSQLQHAPLDQLDPVGGQHVAVHAPVQPAVEVGQPGQFPVAEREPGALRLAQGGPAALRPASRSAPGKPGSARRPIFHRPAQGSGSCPGWTDPFPCIRQPGIDGMPGRGPACSRRRSGSAEAQQEQAFANEAAARDDRRRSSGPGSVSPCRAGAAGAYPSLEIDPLLADRAIAGPSRCGKRTARPPSIKKNSWYMEDRGRGFRDLDLGQHRFRLFAFRRGEFGLVAVPEGDFFGIVADRPPGAAEAVESQLIAIEAARFALSAPGRWPPPSPRRLS